MGLYAELQRPLPTFRFRFEGFGRLQQIAEKLREKYGGAPMEIKPSEHELERVMRELADAGGDVYKLEKRDRRKIHWFLWKASERWSENPEFMERYLAWADRYWGKDGKIGVRRLWKHHLINFDRRSLATRMLAQWLSERVEDLPPRLADFSREWRLFDIKEAPRRAALAILRDDELIGQLESLDINGFQRSAFMCGTLEAVGQLLLTDMRFKTDLPDRLTGLLGPLGEQPIQQMEGTSALKKQATGVLVEGLVQWTERQSNPDMQAQTIQCLDVIVGDPRLHDLRWQSVRPETRDTVIRWLSKLNLEAFIRIMNQLQTNNPVQWGARRDFWEQYLPWISKSWLVAGRQAVRIAERMIGKSYGVFIGPQVQPDHCGLMLQIKELVVFEMNKNGTALFWEAGDPDMPDFFSPEYPRKTILDQCPLENMHSVASASRFSLRHTKNTWQKTFRREIGDRTGIRPPSP